MTTVLGYVIGHVDLNKALHSHVTFHEVTWDLIKASGAVTCVGLRAGGFKANFKMTSRGKSRDNRPRLHHRSCGTKQALQSHVTFHDVTWDMVNASEPVTWHVSWQESSKRAFSWLLGRCHVGSMS